MKIFFVILFFAVSIAKADDLFTPAFREGWRKGWKAGYELVEGKERARRTYVPSPHLPEPGTNSYDGGYDAGFLSGLKKATRKKLCRERGEYGEPF